MTLAQALMRCPKLRASPKRPKRTTRSYVEQRLIELRRNVSSQYNVREK